MRLALVAAVSAWISMLVATAATDQVDDYVRSQLTARKLPGVSVAIVQNGRIVKSAGYGLANLELNTPATPQTVYEIGSITKQFTANAILLLLEDGKRWNYTNAFPLLGMVIERASGLSYTAFVQTRIFDPLALTSARFKTAGEVVAHGAAGYVRADGGFRHGETRRPRVIAANGGIMMNVVDFARWDIALTSGRLLRPDSLRAMTAPVRLNDGRTVSHGLGWFMDQFNGHRFGAHWGTTVTGHSAVIRRYVDDGVTVIVLGNVNDDGLGVDAISKRLADQYVPGVVIHALRPAADQKTPELPRMRRTLESIAKGDDSADAPGLAARLPQPVRERLAETLRAATTFEFLGDESITASHFNLDPMVATLRRYRTATRAGMRYLTLRISASGTLLGVLIED